MIASVVRSHAMKINRTLIACLISAVAGALAMTAWQQTAPRGLAIAQEPGQRSLLRTIETPRPAPSARPGAPTGSFVAAGVSGLEEFAPEERTNILVYEKANRSV